MFCDILDLKNFYETAVGHRAALVIKPYLQSLLGSPQGQTIIAIGYAAPYLETIAQENNVSCFMPASHGVIDTPLLRAHNPVLIDEFEFPLSDQSVDQILLIHSLENISHVRPFLREVWRVLKGEGRIIITVPNRRGLWARSEGNPFSQGQPYSASQLNRLLKDNLFTPLSTQHGLFVPPRFPLLSTTALQWIESFGQAICPKFSGVICISAQKRLYASPPMEYRKRSVRLPKWTTCDVKNLSTHNN